jgi:GNAT superfamily N-acetyltransferase
MTMSLSEKQVTKIRQLEDHSFKAVPAEQEIDLDGWRIRMSGGHTKRINSVNFLTPGQRPADEKIKTVEALFQTAKKAPCFRMTPLASPENLKEILQNSGYSEIDHTDVRLLDLASFQRQDVGASLETSNTLTSDWMSAHLAIKGLNDNLRAPLAAMYERINLPTAYVSCRLNNRTVSIGMAVFSETYVGLFDFMTDQNYQRNGLARDIAVSLLTTAKKRSVKTAYLQVVRDNIDAQKFWQSVGFNDILYSYFYQMKSSTD